MFGQGGQLIKFKGDTDQFPTIIASPTQEPHASFTTADVGTMMGFGPGTGGVLAATLNDAKAQAGGAVVFALSNAVFETALRNGSARRIRHGDGHVAGIFLGRSDQPALVYSRVSVPCSVTNAERRSVH